MRESQKSPNPIIETCLNGISLSATPEQLEQTRLDLAEIKDQNPGIDWRPVYAAYRRREKELSDEHQKDALESEQTSHSESHESATSPGRMPPLLRP
jgi:hypothetical protein